MAFKIVRCIFDCVVPDGRAPDSTVLVPGRTIQNIRQYGQALHRLGTLLYTNKAAQLVDFQTGAPLVANVIKINREFCMETFQEKEDFMLRNFDTADVEGLSETGERIVLEKGKPGVCQTWKICAIYEPRQSPFDDGTWIMHPWVAVVGSEAHKKFLALEGETARLKALREKQAQELELLLDRAANKHIFTSLQKPEARPETGELTVAQPLIKMMAVLPK